MNRSYFVPLVFLAVLFAVSAKAQTGTITGKIYDEQSGDQLIGANVLLVGTSLGATTDIDGRYIIKNVPAGTYALRISYVSYVTKTITDIAVKAGATTALNVNLTSATVQTDEVTVTAERVISSEAAILADRKKAAAIGDGISQEQIKRSPDATSGDALKRVVGISVVDNKFVYVRGTSERYNVTQLNGVRAASTEPDKKAFAFDLLPANLLEHTIVTKTFTPDLPGDFAGGLVQLNTMDFPVNNTFTASFGSAYNTFTTGRAIETYDGGPTDWLGYDTQHRVLPANFPTEFASLSQEEKNALARSLPNLWAKKTRSAPVNPNFHISYGGSTEVLENQLGYVAAFSYRSGYSRTQAQRADYDDAGLRYDYSGQVSSYNVLWGGMVNLSYKLGTAHKLSVKSLLSQTGEDEVVSLTGFNNLTQNDDLLTGFRYLSRNTFSTLVSGDHVLTGLGSMAVNWVASYSRATRSEPDLRRMIYSRSRELPNARYEAQIPFNDSSPESASRFYGELKDYSRSLALNLTFPVLGAKVKSGAEVMNIRRDFAARQFVYTLPVYNPRLTGSALDTLFISSHVGGADGLQFAEYGDRRNRYDAGQTLFATYAMLDLPFDLAGTNWRIVGGARLENSEQRLNSGNLQNEDVRVAYKQIDVLPSLNLTWLTTETMNLRFAFSRTVNRPEFREFAPFAFYDFSSQLTVYGNPNLKRALVRNYDVRWEWFPNPGELLSVSYFRKEITDAIEQIVVSTVALAGERTYDNAPSADNYGIELEMRKSLGFLGGVFEDVSVLLNYSRIFSSVRLTDRTRTLQGQSPYVINAGLFVTLPGVGTSLSMMYNRFGERISEVATVFTQDVKEQPRDVVDVTLTQKVFGTLEVKLSGRDILEQEQRFTQGDQLVRVNKRGASYSLGISVKL
jgi:outer membrane receptor protein involved in Fe transport